eukprot:17075_1
MANNKSPTHLICLANFSIIIIQTSLLSVVITCPFICYLSYINFYAGLDIVIWLSFTSICYTSLLFIIYMDFQSDDWIHFVAMNSIIPRSITQQILHLLTWQHYFVNWIPPTIFDTSVFTYESANSVSNIHQIFHKSNHNTSNKCNNELFHYMIIAIHSLCQSIIICCIFSDHYDETKTLLYPLLVLFIIDFICKSLYFIALIIPQFYYKSFVFSWFSFIVDYIRLLIVICCSKYDTNLYNIWKYELYPVISLIIFIVCCLSFTHA